MAYDFGGWASKNDLLCKDGRIIKQDAFKPQNGQKVPLVWNHQHGSVSSVLGHALLENRPEGVYVHGKFNETEHGKHAKQAVENGDVTHLSIWANELKQDGPEVYHGVIREVSLVLAGANPGASIESVVMHGMPMDDYDEEAILYTNDELVLIHGDKIEPKKENDVAGKKPEDKTVREIFDSMNEEQQTVVVAMLAAVAGDGDDEKGDDSDMKHNIFEGQNQNDQQDYLSHSDMTAIFDEARRVGSLKAAVTNRLGDDVLVHATPINGMTTPSGTEAARTYGIKGMNFLYAEDKDLYTPPIFINGNTEWVSNVMGSIRRTPFSRIRTIFADITADEARAKGYITGKKKVEEVITTLRRSTSPQTIYKKQKLDRDDILDITDFNVVAWIKQEMRVKLDEEIARAILIGDGRQGSSDDKISEEHIRPVINDVDLFNTSVVVKGPSMTGKEKAKKLIDEIIRSRKHYKGSGNPTFYTHEDIVTEMLLLEDGMGHKLYKTEAELATALRVSKIITVEPMASMNKMISMPASGSGTIEVKHDLAGVIVNLNDYRVGADRGGEINMFDDFDIDYNQQKYLMETRISGALVVPFSAVTFWVQEK